MFNTPELMFNVNDGSGGSTVEQELEQIINQQQAQTNPNPPASTEQNTQTDPNAQAQSTEGNQQTPEQNEQSKQNKAFAEMRTQIAELTKQQQMFDALAKQQGYESIADMQAKLEEKKLQEEANAAQVPPEIMARLKQLEAAEQMRNEQMMMNSFGQRIEQLRTKHELTPEQLRDFATNAGNLGIDLRTTNIPYEILFNGMNFDSNKDAIVEAAKQNWLKELEQNRTISPNINNQTIGSSQPKAPSNAGDVAKGLYEQLGIKLN